MKFINYGAQQIERDDIQAVVKALKSDFLTQGPTVPKFEKQLTAFMGAKYAVAVNSGTAALHAAYFALGLKKGDEIITTPMTFAATTNAALYLGAKPVFVDIDPVNGCIDPNLIEAKITAKTKIITVVDYGGQPVEFKKIKSIAKKHKIKIVDDACHALGATYNQSLLGKGDYADATILSFHPVKHITTGEGGAALFNDKTAYDRALQFRTHGITKDANQFEFEPHGNWYHEMQFLGFNYRLTEIQAALGITQLKKIKQFLKRRRKIAATYFKKMDGNPYFDLPPQIKGTEHAYHLYPIRLKKDLLAHKNELMSLLHDKGIGTQVHYIPVYYHPYYQSLGYKPGLCPNAQDYYESVLSIPMYSRLMDKDVDRVIAALLNTSKKIVGK